MTTVLSHVLESEDNQSSETEKTYGLMPAKRATSGRMIEKGKEGLEDRVMQAYSLDLSVWKQHLFLRITTICERQKRNKKTAVP